MNRQSAILALLVAAFAYSAAVLADDTEQMIREAISYHDQQEFGRAVALLEQVLDLEPANGNAFYELAYTHQVSGDMTSCIAVAREGLAKIGSDEEQSYLVPALSMLYGSCASAAGRTAEALEIFRATLADFPDDYGLNFNIAVTLSNTGQYDDAIEYFSRAIRADPFHPSPYYTLGAVYEQKGLRMHALLAFLNFLQREYNTPRSSLAAQSVFEIALAQVGVAESGKVGEIYVDAADKRNAADAIALSLALSVAVLAHVSDGELDEPVAASLAEILASFIGIAADLEPGSDENTTFSLYLLPGVGRVEEHAVSEAFAYYVASTAGVPGSADWMQAHAADVDALVGYLNMLEEERYEEPF